MSNIVHTSRGTYNIKKVSIVADRVAKQLLVDLESYKRYPGLKVITDPLDSTKRYVTPLDAVSWAVTQTEAAFVVPMVLTLSGACLSSAAAMPALLEHLSDKTDVAEAIAKLHGVQVGTYKVLADILLGYLDQFGHKFVAEVVAECRNGELLDSLEEVIEFVQDNFNLTSIGTYLPTEGLTHEQVSDIIGTYMADCGDDFADAEGFDEYR